MTRPRLAVAAALGLLFGATAAPAADVSPRATIRAIRRVVLPDVVRVTIELDREVVFHDERIEYPRRVFVDLRATAPDPSLGSGTLRFEQDGAPVRQIRLGRQADGTTRVVLDAIDVGAYSVYPIYNPFRLVVDCARTPPAVVRAAPPVAAPPPTRARPTPAPVPVLKPLPARRLATAWAIPMPDGEPAATAALREASAPVASIQAPPLPPAPTPDRVTVIAAPPPPRMTGAVSVARQLGLGVSRIVIDPGHGGHDRGAQHDGVDEADVVLDVALRLEKLLRKASGTSVVLTRRTDDFVALQERTALANRESADLFLSIHGNAHASPEARGVETYFLNFASTLSAAAVATRENAASGQTMGALPDFVKTIALNNKLDESRDLAALVQQGLVEKLRQANRPVRDLGVKQAPFVVLIGAAMPSVLAEVSFVTNPQEAKLLKTPAYRQRIADGLFSAIRTYQTSLQSVPTAALRTGE